MYVGQYQTLTVDRLTDPGAFLTDGDDDVLLPNRYVPHKIKKGDKIKVFIYRDSEDRIIATTKTPAAKINEFALPKSKRCE